MVIAAKMFAISTLFLPVRSNDAGIPGMPPNLDLGMGGGMGGLNLDVPLGMGGGMGGPGGPGGNAPPEDPFPPVKSDVKFIACSTCKALARRLHSDMSKWGNVITKSEDEIRNKVAEMCTSGTEGGAWFSEFDMVESKDGQVIDLKRQPTKGECEVECKTIELACKDILQEADIDLVVGLYKSFKKGRPFDRKSLTERLCTEEDAWAANIEGSCTGSIPKVPKTRKAGPVFRTKGSPPVAPGDVEPVAPTKGKKTKKKKKGKAVETSSEL